MQIELSISFYMYVLYLFSGWHKNLGGLNMGHTLVPQLVERQAAMREVGREFDSGQTNTQGLKVTEEKVLRL